MPGFFGNLKERVGAGGLSGALRAFGRRNDGGQDEAGGEVPEEIDLESGRKPGREGSGSMFQSVRGTMLKSSFGSKFSMMMENVPSGRFRQGMGGRGRLFNKQLRRHQALKMLKDPAEVKSLSKLRAKLKMTRKKESKEGEGDNWNKDGEKKDQEQEEGPAEAADDDEELLDVIAELGLTVEPSVEELGDPRIIEQRKNGTLNVKDENTVLTFKRHKAKKGRVIFEAENANNIACEMYLAADIETAQLYYKRALELVSQDRKPAVEELDELVRFVGEWYSGDVSEFYAALSEGEWRMALGRRRFVQVMKKLEYPGNPERVFSMLDSLSPDGKISLPELQVLTKLLTKPHRLLVMDRDLFEKGVVMSNLACCHLQKGEAIVGLQKLRDAMTIITAHGVGIESSTVQRIMGNIAVAYIKLGDLDAALDYLAQLVEFREKTAGRLNDGVLTALFHVGFCFLVKANTFNILGDCQRPDGRVQEKPVEVNFALALCAFKERLRRQEEKFVNVDENTTQNDRDELRLEIARTQEIVAEIHEKCGEPHRAVEFLRQAVAHKEGILCDSDPELLSSWNIYAGICFKSGRFQDALEFMTKATDTSAALFGEVSVTVAKELYHSGLILFKMGAQQFRTEERDASLKTYSDALEKLQQALPIQEDLQGDDQADIADNVHLCGSIHLARHELNDARKNFEQALLARLKCFGRTHIKVASSCHALGCLYARMPRRREEAIQLLRKAVLIREKRLGHESLYLAESLHELGSALMQRAGEKDADTALQHLSKAASIRDNRVGKKSLLYAASMHQIGQAHLHVECPAEAKLYFQAAVTLREELLGKKCAQTAASKSGLAMALYQLGDLKLSMKNFKASYTAREFLFGMEHPLSADSLHWIGQVYVKKHELKASLPFFLAALDIRKTLNQKDVERLENDSDEEEKYVYRPESERQRRIRHKKEKARLEKIKRKKEEAREEARRQAREEKERKKLEEEERKRMLAESRDTIGGGMAGGQSFAVASMFGGFRQKLSRFRSGFGGGGSGDDEDDEDFDGSEHDSNTSGGGRRSRRSSSRRSMSRTSTMTSSDGSGEGRRSRRSKSSASMGEDSEEGRHERKSRRSSTMKSLSSSASMGEDSDEGRHERKSRRSSTMKSLSSSASVGEDSDEGGHERKSRRSSTMKSLKSMSSSASMEEDSEEGGHERKSRKSSTMKSLSSSASLGRSNSSASPQDQDEDEASESSAKVGRGSTASVSFERSTTEGLGRSGGLRSSLAGGRQSKHARGSVVSIMSAASYVSTGPAMVDAAKRASGRKSKRTSQMEDGEGSEEEEGSNPSLYGDGELLPEEEQEGTGFNQQSMKSTMSLVRDEDADSEVDISEIGIDVRGCLAPILAYDFHTISKVYLDLKDYDAAKEFLDQSICLREEVFGSSSSEYAEALHAFGQLYCKQHLPASSLKYFLKALAVRERICGHLHPETAQTEIELGEALAEVGQPDEASIHLLRGCNIRESIFGIDDAYSKRLREKWSGLSAGATYFDPVAEGEALPHFSRRSPESFLHGYASAHLSHLQIKKKQVSEEEFDDMEDDEEEDEDDEDDDDEIIEGGDLFESEANPAPSEPANDEE